MSTFFASVACPSWIDSFELFDMFIIDSYKLLFFCSVSSCYYPTRLLILTLFSLVSSCIMWLFYLIAPLLFSCFVSSSINFELSSTCRKVVSFRYVLKEKFSFCSLSCVILALDSSLSGISWDTSISNPGPELVKPFIWVSLRVKLQSGFYESSLIA